MRPSRLTLAISQEVQVKNKTVYLRKAPSDSLLGGWKMITVTRKAYNRKRSHAKTTTRRADFTALGIMVGISLGCLYLSNFYEPTISLFTASAQEVATPVPTPEPVEGEEAKTTDAGQASTSTPSATSKSEKQQIIDYIVEVFGEDAPAAFNVLFCENASLNPRAVNHNRNGSRDLGVFQLNDAYHGGEENFDYKRNVDKAYQIFKSHGSKWTAWTCSHRVGQKNYLGK